MTAGEISAEVFAAETARIGQLLRSGRTKRGVSVEDLARELHLQVRQVHALENGDFSGFNSPAFVKGYLRAYARFCALNGDALVQMYDAVLPKKKEIVVPAPVRAEWQIVQSSQRKGIRATLLLVSVLLAGLFGWQFRLADRLLPSDQLVLPDVLPPPLVSKIESVDASGILPVAPAALEAGPASDSVSLPESMVSATPAPVPAAPLMAAASRSERGPDDLPGQEPVPEGDAVLHIEFMDDCWVQLKADNGKVLHDKTHKKGEIFDMAVKTPLHVWFGKAAAVNVSYNGIAVTVPVKPGFQSAKFILGDEAPSSETE